MVVGSREGENPETVFERARDEVLSLSDSFPEVLFHDDDCEIREAGAGRPIDEDVEDDETFLAKFDSDDDLGICFGGNSLEGDRSSSCKSAGGCIANRLSLEGATGGLNVEELPEGGESCDQPRVCVFAYERACSSCSFRTVISRLASARRVSDDA